LELEFRKRIKIKERINPNPKSLIFELSFTLHDLMEITDDLSAKERIVDLIFGN
jgi:hypothetical protein